MQKAQGFYFEYRKTSNISQTLDSNKIVDQPGDLTVDVNTPSHLVLKTKFHPKDY